MKGFCHGFSMIKFKLPSLTICCNFMFSFRQIQQCQIINFNKLFKDFKKQIICVDITKKVVKQRLISKECFFFNGKICFTKCF